MSENRPDITELIARLRGGDDAAMQRLFPLAYDALRELAHTDARAAASLDISS